MNYGNLIHRWAVYINWIESFVDYLIEVRHNWMTKISTMEYLFCRKVPLMSTYRQKCARQLCGQLKSNQNMQIWYKLAINKVCYPHFVSSYQDTKNEMIALTEKCCLYPRTGKNVPDSFVDNSNPIKIGRYIIFWQ